MCQEKGTQTANFINTENNNEQRTFPDDNITIKGLIAKEGVYECYIYRILNLALLPPRLTTAILEGRQ